MVSRSVQTVQSSPAQKGPGYASVTPPHFLQQLLGYRVPSTQSHAVPYQLANGQPLFNGQPLSSHVRIGCMDKSAANYDPTATQDSGQCVQWIIPGCNDSRAYNYNPRANVTYDGACWFAQPELGCTDPRALNFNPSAKQNDGKCVSRVSGCTNVNAVNFDPKANTNDGSCINFEVGCTDPKAKNFDVNATVDSGSCWYPRQGCLDPVSPSYDWRVIQQKPGGCCPPKPAQVGLKDRELAPGLAVPCATCCDSN